jgi:uncharacterized phage-associated protein
MQRIARAHCELRKGVAMAVSAARPCVTLKYDHETRDLLDEVYAVYGQFSAWKLRNMTHQEPPWLTTPEGKEISHDTLRAYFVTQVQV